MKLPNSDSAYIASRKLKEYLLSESHPIGRSKAKFFRSLGFDEKNFNLLERGLTTIVRSQEVKEIESSPVTPQLRGCTKGHCEERSDEAISCRWPFDSDNGMRLLRRPERLGRLAMTPSSSVSEALPSPHGTKCIIEGFIGTPSGNQVQIRTVWIIETGEARPRFVTAYPL